MAALPNLRAVMRDARRNAVLTAALLILVATSVADEMHPAIKPREKLLLLRNGNIVKGTITPEGDRYHVLVRDGDLSIRASDVEFVGRDLDDVYWHRRSRIRPGVAEEHLMLADWCLRHRLVDYARGELNDALHADSAHPRLAILERRLMLAIPRTYPAKGDRAISHLPTTEELNRIVHGMPPGTMKKFSIAIQPLLLSTCAAARCHGSRSANSFRLLRPSPGRTPSRRLIQRNLYSTLKWIDRTNPDASPILTTPLEPHGINSTAVFTSRDLGHYRQLASWVSDLADAKREEDPSSIEARSKPLLQQKHWPARPARSSAGPRDAVSTISPAESVEAPALRHRLPRDGSRPGRFVPLDEFDPEIFNRLFGLTKKRAGEAIEDAQESTPIGE